MGYTKLKKCLLALSLLSVSSAWASTTVWVTDKIEVQLRSGPGNQYRVVKALQIGTELIQRDAGENNGYVRVSLENGEDGWIASRLLSSTPVAHVEAEENSKRMARLNDEIRQLKSERDSLKAQKENAEKSIQNLNGESARMASEVTAIKQASANVLQIQNERDQLTQEKVNLESQLETIKREKESMDSSLKQDWFMIGAGVLFGGIALGLILPRLTWRKKNSWNSF